MPLSSSSIWERFWSAYAEQTRFIIRRIVHLYEKTESVRAEFAPTPYLSCLVRGCAEKALDVTQGGPELSFVTIEEGPYVHDLEKMIGKRIERRSVHARSR